MTEVIEKRVDGKLIKLHFNDGLIESVEIGNKRYSKSELEFLANIYYRLLDFEIEYLKGA
jgi:hypothetical protein